MPGISSQPELDKKTFKSLCVLVKEKAGIHLHEGKYELVKARLNKRLRELDIDDYKVYVEHVREDKSGEELVVMLDSISTNVTSFFREEGHFDYIADKIIKPMLQKSGTFDHGTLRIWSAGCSSGQEPYTTAILLNETIPDIKKWDIRILATDLSTRVLEMAKKGFYTDSQITGINPVLRQKYFDTVVENNNGGYRIKDNIKKMVSFARLNLLEKWPMQGPFDIIFCRNVMIYFEKDIREKLVNGFWSRLRSGGKLFIGHSESLTSINHQFEYVEPTIYRRK